MIMGLVLTSFKLEAVLTQKAMVTNLGSPTVSIIDLTKSTYPVITVDVGDDPDSVKIATREESGANVLLQQKTTMLRQKGL